MKWYRYEIVLNSGKKYEYVCGEWLKESNYVFGKVKIIEEITESELKEKEEMEDELFSMWNKLFDAGYFEK